MKKKRENNFPGFMPAETLSLSFAGTQTLSYEEILRKEKNKKGEPQLRNSRLS